MQCVYSIIRRPADWLEDFKNYSSFSDPAQTESRLLENVHQYSIDVVKVGVTSFGVSASKAL